MQYDKIVWREPGNKIIVIMRYIEEPWLIRLKRLSEDIYIPSSTYILIIIIILLIWFLTVLVVYSCNQTNEFCEKYIFLFQCYLICYRYDIRTNIQKIQEIIAPCSAV